jgi:hypothetical protein
MVSSAQLKYIHNASFRGAQQRSAHTFYFLLQMTSYSFIAEQDVKATALYVGGSRRTNFLRHPEAVQFLAATFGEFLGINLKPVALKERPRRKTRLGENR